MNKEIPGEIPDETNNPFKDLEEMKVEITDNAQTPKKKEKDPWKEYRKTFNHEKGSVEGKQPTGGGRFQGKNCKINPCPIRKENMDNLCSGCDGEKLTKIRNIENNMKGL